MEERVRNPYTCRNLPTPESIGKRHSTTPKRRQRQQEQQRRKPQSHPGDLARLPSELRVVVFEHYLKHVFPWNGRATPSLIVALRGIPILYDEIINVFYRVSTFVLSWERKPKAMQMSRDLLRTIRSLRVDFGFVSNPNDRVIIPIPIPEHPIRLAVNISTLELDFQEPITNVALVEDFITGLPALHTLILHIPSKGSLEPPNSRALTVVVMPGHAPINLSSNCNRFPPPIFEINMCTRIRCIETIHKDKSTTYKWTTKSQSQGHGQTKGSHRPLTWTDMRNYFRSIPIARIPSICRIPSGFASMLETLTLLHRTANFSYKHTSFIGLNPRFWYRFCSYEVCPCHPLRPDMMTGRKLVPNSDLLRRHLKQLNRTERPLAFKEISEEEIIEDDLLGVGDDTIAAMNQLFL